MELRLLIVLGIIKSFACNPGSLCFLPTSVSLWQVNLLSCRQGKTSDPSEFLTTTLLQNTGRFHWSSMFPHATFQSVSQEVILFLIVTTIDSFAFSGASRSWNHNISAFVFICFTQHNICEIHPCFCVYQ